MANGVMLGAGTIESPFLIEDLADLKKISSNMSASYKLVNDIDCSPGIARIGNTFTAFKGTLNGDGHFIRNMTINTPTINVVGLFALTVGATITNLGFDNCTVSGLKEVGIIAGRERYSVFDNITMTNVQVNASGDKSGLVVGSCMAYNTTVRNSNVQGKIVSTSADLATVGGLVGDSTNSSEITIIDNCVADVVIESLGQYVGGLIGATKASRVTNSKVYAHISSQYSAIACIGGAIGYVTASDGVSFDNCRVKGTVYGKGNRVGGFVGFVYTDSNTPETTFTNCGADVDVEGNMEVGGFVGSTTTAVSNYLVHFKKCFAIGVVKGNTSHVGGFGGVLGEVNVSDCYAIAEITSPESQFTGGFVGQYKEPKYVSNILINSYSASSFINQGAGFGGTMSSVGVSGCYYDYEVGGTQPVAIPGVTAITTAQLQEQATFQGWDFESTWTMIQYPQFKVMVQDDRYGIKGVVMKDGQPISGAVVLLFSEKDRLYRRTVSDHNGEWVFASIVPERDFVVHAYWSDIEGNRYISSSSPYVLPVVLV